VSRRHLVLLGCRGSGKSTLGPPLAALLGLPFVDLDTEIEREEGASVAEIFATSGEAHFRRRESRLLRRVLEGPPVLLAPGGGVILDPENRRLLRGCSRRIYLRVTPAELQVRLGRQPPRPRLTSLAPRDEVEALLAERDPIYRDLATDVIDVADGEARDQTLAKVRRKLEVPLG
jgi:shikimate kinase/3-dehydroquinate synthase